MKNSERFTNQYVSNSSVVFGSGVVVALRRVRAQPTLTPQEIRSDLEMVFNKVQLMCCLRRERMY